MNQFLSAEFLPRVKRAYDNRIGYGKRPALILIDFVEAYFDRGCALYAGVEDALASAGIARATSEPTAVPSAGVASRL